MAEEYNFDSLHHLVKTNLQTTLVETKRDLELKKDPNTRNQKRLHNYMIALWAADENFSCLSEIHTKAAENFAFGWRPAVPWDGN